MARLEAVKGKVVVGALLITFCMLAVLVSAADAATVRVVTSGDGSGVVRIEVAGGPPGAAGYWGDCPSYCGPADVDEILLEGYSTTMVFTAQPAEGSVFSGWSGACTGTAPLCQVPLVGSVEATATFTRNAAPPRDSSSDPAPSFLVGGEAILSSTTSGRPGSPRPVTIDLTLSTSGDPLGPIGRKLCCTPRGGGLYFTLPRTLLRAATDDNFRPGALCNLAASRDKYKPCPISTRIATGEVTTVRVMSTPRGMRERWLIDFYALGPKENIRNPGRNNQTYIGRKYLVTLRKGDFIAVYDGRANIEQTTANLLAPLPEEVRSKILIVDGRMRLGGTSAGKSWVASTGCPSSGGHIIRWSVVKGGGSPGKPLRARCTR